MMESTYSSGPSLFELSALIRLSTNKTSQLTRTPSRTTTNDSNLRRITTKSTNIPLHPIQRRPLIQKPNIRLSILTDSSAGQEPKSAEPILQRDINHRPAGSVHDGRARESVRAALCETAAVDHHHDRKRAALRLRGHDHIETEAVFFSRDGEIDGQVASLRWSPGWRSLHAGGSRALGIEDLGGFEVVVRFDVLGRSPAKFTGWGLCVLDSVEDVCACETCVAFILGVSEVDYRRAGVSYQSSMRA